MNNQKKVLITGASGIIGRATVEILEYTGWKVVKASRSVKLSFEEGFIYLDISSPEKIMSLANEYHFDAIVHLAAMVDLSNDTESDMYIPNVLSTGCLAYLAKFWLSEPIDVIRRYLGVCDKYEIDVVVCVTADCPVISTEITDFLLKSHFDRSEEHTSELQSHHDLVCRLLLEKKKNSIMKHSLFFPALYSHMYP